MSQLWGTLSSGLIGCDCDKVDNWSKLIEQVRLDKNSHEGHDIRINTWWNSG